MCKHVCVCVCCVHVIVNFVLLSQLSQMCIDVADVPCCDEEFRKKVGCCCIQDNFEQI